MKNNDFLKSNIVIMLKKYIFKYLGKEYNLK